MGNLKLTSTHPRMPANVTALPVGGDVKLRARRLAPAATAAAHLPRADQLALADIAQRFAPGSQTAAAPDEQKPEGEPQPTQIEHVQSAPVAAAPPTATPPTGLRMLIAALIVVALLPSALFAAMIWFGAVHLGWPESWLKTQGQAWSTAAPASVTGALALSKPQAQPEPEAAADPAAAAIPPQAQPDAVAAEAPEPKPVKTVAVTGPAEGRQDDIRAASPQADPEAKEVELTGSIAPTSDDAGAEELPYDTNLIGVVSWDNEKQALLGATGVEEVFTTPDDAPPPPEHLMRAPDEDDEGKTWITAPQFVNLRKGPTSSAAVISIIAKGAKLEVLGRKRGWVKVANPETSESGWIYTGSKARRMPRGTNAESAGGGSFWSSLFGGSD